MCCCSDVPFFAILALLLCWAGILIFSIKVYEGAHTAQLIAEDLFGQQIAGYIQHVKVLTVAVGIIMGVATMIMAVISCFASRHAKALRSGHTPHFWLRHFGHDLACAVVVCINYVLSICWIAIFTGLVLLLAGYLGFSPLCLPKVGHPDELCLNFSWLSRALFHDDRDKMVNLALCGHPIDQFCHLTCSVLDWYWYAYAGCITVMIGLSHFNATLAANYGHNRQARLTKDATMKTNRSLEPVQQPSIPSEVSKLLSSAPAAQEIDKEKDHGVSGNVAEDENSCLTNYQPSSNESGKKIQEKDAQN